MRIQIKSILLLFNKFQSFEIKLNPKQQSWQTWRTLCWYSSLMSRKSSWMISAWQVFMSSRRKHPKSHKHTALPFDEGTQMSEHECSWQGSVDVRIFKVSTIVLQVLRCVYFAVLDWNKLLWQKKHRHVIKYNI